MTNRIGELENIVKLSDTRLKNELQSMNKELELVEKKLINKERELSDVKSNYDERVRQLEKTNSSEREKTIVAER